MARTPPPLSRSISSSTLWSYCQKKYFLQYYTNTLKGVDIDLRLETLLFKNLASYKMWIGTHTHFILSDYLLARKEGPVDDTTLQNIIALSVETMTLEFQFSEQRGFERYDKDNKFGLNEHAYGWELPEDALQEALRRVSANLDAFLASDLHNEIAQHIIDGNAVFVETKEPNFEQMKVNLSDIPELVGVNIWAQPDAGAVTKDGTYIIYDWKSGTIRDERRENPLSEQLKVYALKILTKTKKTLDNATIEGYEIYVPSMERFGGKITPENITTITERLVNDVQSIRSYLVDGDVVKNKPIDGERFLRTEDTNKCTTCRLLQVCDKLKKFEKPTLF